MFAILALKKKKKSQSGMTLRTVMQVQGQDRET